MNILYFRFLLKLLSLCLQCVPNIYICTEVYRYRKGKKYWIHHWHVLIPFLAKPKHARVVFSNTLILNLKFTCSNKINWNRNLISLTENNSFKNYSILKVAHHTWIKFLNQDEIVWWLKKWSNILQIWLYKRQMKYHFLVKIWLSKTYFSNF